MSADSELLERKNRTEQNKTKTPPHSVSICFFFYWRYVMSKRADLEYGHISITRKLLKQICFKQKANWVVQYYFKEWIMHIKDSKNKKLKLNMSTTSSLKHGKHLIFPGICWTDLLSSRVVAFLCISFCLLLSSRLCSIMYWVAASSSSSSSWMPNRSSSMMPE